MRPKSLFKAIGQTLRPAGGNQLVPYLGAQPASLLSGRVTLTSLSDTSGSLTDYIEAVRAAYGQLFSQVRGDPWLAERTDASIYCLGNDQPATMLADWAAAARLEAPPLPLCGHTPLCGAIAQVLETAVERSNALTHEHHCDEALNLVLVVSDFMPTDGLDARAQMEAALRRASEAGVQLILLTVGHVDEAMANAIAQPGRPPIPLQSVEDFTSFFQLIGRSIRERSMTIGGAPLQIEFQGHTLRLDK